MLTTYSKLLLVCDDKIYIRKILKKNQLGTFDSGVVDTIGLSIYSYFIQ